MFRVWYGRCGLFTVVVVWLFEVPGCVVFVMMGLRVSVHCWTGLWCLVSQSGFVFIVLS